jgi:hypothetical protein
VRATRVRFTIRQLLVLIAILGILLGVGKWAHDRYGGQTFVKTYYVGDLIRHDGQTGVSPTIGDLSEQAAILKSSVTPDVWWLSTRSVTPFFLSKSLIVRQTEWGHQQVADWLRQQRKSLYARNP